MNARGRIAALLFAPAVMLLSGGAACREPNTIPPHYFLLLHTPLQGDQGRPSKPTSLTAVFQPVLREIELNWTGSVDPDTGGSQLVYRVYLYLDGPPQEYYREQDLLGESVLTTFYVPSGAYTGTLYFVVTAFDGAAESEPSDWVGLDLLPPVDED